MKQSPFLLQLVIPSAKTGYNPNDLSGQVVIHTFITGVGKESHSSWVIKTNYYCHNTTVHEVNWLRNRHRLRVAPVLLPTKNDTESTGSDAYWRETELAGKNWRKGDSFMLDDTAMDLLQSQ